MKFIQHRRHFLLSLLLSSSLLFSGCTQEDAKVLKDTAKLFGQESSAAIEAVETMILAETKEPTQTEAEKKVRFLRIILDQKIDDPLLQTAIEQLMKPVEPSKREVTSFKRYMANLKKQYATLVSIYDDLERGHLLAKDAVKKSKEPLQKLTFQMSYLAVCADAYPADLIKQKNVLFVEIIRLRQSYFSTKWTQITLFIPNLLKLYDGLI